MKESLEASQPKTGSRQVFWLPRQNRVLVVVALVGAVAAVAGPVRSNFQANGQPWLSIPFVVIASVAAAIVGLLLWQVFGTYLIVAPDGLEYHELGITLAAAWRDVRAVKTRRFIAGGRGGSWSAEGLVLRQSQTRANAICAMLFRTRGGSDFVPLTPFALRWRSTELGALIRRYATHLDKAIDT